MAYLYLLAFIITWDAKHCIFVNVEIPNAFKWVVTKAHSPLKMKPSLLPGEIQWCLYAASHGKLFNQGCLCYCNSWVTSSVVIIPCRYISKKWFKSLYGLVPVMHSHLSALFKFNNKTLIFDRRIIASSCTNTQHRSNLLYNLPEYHRFEIKPIFNI